MNTVNCRTIIKIMACCFLLLGLISISACSNSGNDDPQEKESTSNDSDDNNSDDSDSDDKDSNNGTSPVTNPAPTPNPDPVQEPNLDQDNDQMLDTWEIENGLDPSDPDDANSDLDNDGLNALQEMQAGSDPNNPDTDGDGVFDGLDDDPLNAPLPSTNLAYLQFASQSSVNFEGSAERATDGSTDGRYGNNSVTHTTTEPFPWWQVNLGALYKLGSIKLWNRTDNCCNDRLSNFTVFVSDKDMTGISYQALLDDDSVWKHTEPGIPGAEYIIGDINKVGQYVKIQIDSTAILSLAEVHVFPPGPGTNSLPVAKINSVSPNLAIEGDVIVFDGQGTDSDGTITAHEWSSDIQNILGTVSNFSRSDLVVGNHQISLRVQDNNGDWSQPASVNLNVNAASTNDILSVNFDNNIAGPYTQSQMESDFPGLDLNFTGTSVNFDLLDIVDDSNAYSGRSLRVTIPANRNEFNSGISTNVILTNTYDELYLSYYVKFGESDFQWPSTGKLFALSGPQYIHVKPTGTNGFSSFTNFGSNGKIYAYIYHMDGPDDDPVSGNGRGDTLWNQTTGFFPVSQWIQVKQRLKLNTPGLSDGISEMWVDGELAFQDTSMRFRTVDTLGIKRLIFYTRARELPAEGYIYLDDIKISESGDNM